MCSVFCRMSLCLGEFLGVLPLSAWGVRVVAGGVLAPGGGSHPGVFAWPRAAGLIVPPCRAALERPPSTLLNVVAAPPLVT